MSGCCVTHVHAVCMCLCIFVHVFYISALTYLCCACVSACMCMFMSLCVHTSQAQLAGAPSCCVCSCSVRGSSLSAGVHHGGGRQSQFLSPGWTLLPRVSVCARCTLKPLGDRLSLCLHQQHTRPCLPMPSQPYADSLARTQHLGAGLVALIWPVEVNST